MRFAYIDNEEFDLIAESDVKLCEVPSLGTEWWSGVAAENQGYRFLAIERRELHQFAAFEAGQFEVRCVRTDRWTLRFPLCDKLHRNRSPFRFHCAGEGHHPIEVLFGQMFSE